MPGETPYDAFQHFARPIQAALNCVTPAKLGRPRIEIDALQILTFQHGEPVELKREGERARLFLDITIRYRLVRVDDPNDPRGPLRASTDGYMFSIRDNRKLEVISFHWDPRSQKSKSYPHLHIGSRVLDTEDADFGEQFSGLHIPTGRITIEDTVRFLIEEFKVRPLKSDWDSILENSKSIHVQYRSWA